MALARGWERQLDIADNGLFYVPDLTAGAYAAWLRATGVAYVALPDAPLDYSARAEAGLIRSGLPFLRLVGRLRHWRVYAVSAPRRLASPPARLTALGPDRFTMAFARPGTSVVRLRFSDYWTAPGACVGRAPGGFTAVRSERPGRVSVTARLDRGLRLERGRVCGPSPGPAGRVGDSAGTGGGPGGAG
ncbi:MAG: hypothetical protein LC720_00660 [Actinobacteria bacterium]|nr:hypothetical protein [Actinomycetota bacterium]